MPGQAFAYLRVSKLDQDLEKNKLDRLKSRLVDHVLLEGHGLKPIELVRAFVLPDTTGLRHYTIRSDVFPVHTT